MEEAFSQLRGLGIKFFCEDDAFLRLADAVPVFHAWIRTHALDGLLIDVADYEHVHEGPGIVLVAHEGNYSLDRAGGRLGVSYCSKQLLPGGLSDRLLSVARSALKACCLLQQDASLAGRIQFRGDGIEVVANDRLLASNSDETLKAFRPVLDELCGTLFGDASCEVSRRENPKERFTLQIKSAKAVPLTELAERVGV
jgi:hypothetical protein